MSLKTLETLTADRLDQMVLRQGAMTAQGANDSVREWNNLLQMETNGLCLALRAFYAEENVMDPDHFPSPNFLSEEWRAKHRSIT